MPGYASANLSNRYSIGSVTWPTVSRVGKFQFRVQGKGLLPMTISLAALGARVMEVGQTAMGTGLLEPISDLDRQAQRRFILGEGRFQPVGRAQGVTEVVERLHLAGTVAAIAVDAQRPLKVFHRLGVVALANVDHAQIVQHMRDARLVADVAIDFTRLAWCSGASVTDTRNTVSPKMIGVDCNNMSHGASGGPWLWSYNSTTGYGYANSVNEGGFGSDPHIWGPYFDSLFGAVYDAVKNA